jgi:hypothetical protein
MGDLIVNHFDKVYAELETFSEVNTMQLIQHMSVAPEPDYVLGLFLDYIQPLSVQMNLSESEKNPISPPQRNWGCTRPL